MKRFLFNLWAVSIIVVSFSLFASAQIKPTKNAKLIAEVTALRSKLVEAIKRRDEKTLAKLYAADFTHTHAIGRVDDQPKRIAALVAGDATIESIDPDELDIRTYGQETAIAVGQSTVPGANQTATKYRWTIVYVKSKNGWQVVASQATKIQ